MNTKLPVKLHRNREKTFTTKRDNYKNYTKAKWKWIDIYLEVNESKKYNKRAIYDIADKYNIKYSTLKRRYREWNLNGNKYEINIETRGGAKKIFTENEEKDLANYIKDLYIKNKLFFDNDCIKVVALKKYKLLCELNPLRKKNFDCSIGWIVDFKKKWKLSTKRYNYSKESNKIDKDAIKKYYDNCSYIDRVYYKIYIFNLDETFWRIMNMSSTILGIKGEPRKFISNINEKSGYTTIFIISAGGKIFKPLIILKGTTKVTLNKISIINDNLVYKKYNKSGWVDDDILLFLLKEIAKYTNYKQSILLLDNYSIHKDEIIEKIANSLNIKLIFIPPYMTSECQPLDVKFNGPVKSIAKYLNKEFFLENPFSTPTIADSINFLIESLNKMKPSTVQKAFSLACDFTYNNNENAVF